MKKILIIEDEKMLREMYEEKFKMEGFKVFSSSDAEDGLINTQIERPDIVILDILLPNKNGIEYLEELKKVSDKPLKVIVFSNYDDTETKERALELGAEDYLIKADYTPQELVYIVKSKLI